MDDAATIPAAEPVSTPEVTAEAAEAPANPTPAGSTSDSGAPSTAPAAASTTSTASPTTFPQILHDDLVALLARLATWEHAAAAAVQSDIEAAVAKLKALLTL